MKRRDLFKGCAALLGMVAIKPIIKLALAPPKPATATFGTIRVKLGNLGPIAEERLKEAVCVSCLPTNSRFDWYNSTEIKIPAMGQWEGGNG